MAQAWPAHNSHSAGSGPPAVDRSTKSCNSLWLLPHPQVGLGGSPTWQLTSLIFFLPPLCSATDLFSPGRDVLERHCAWGVTQLWSQPRPSGPKALRDTLGPH